MAVNEFIEELKRREAEQAKLGGFNAPAPAAPGFQPQTPMAQPQSVFNAPAGGVAAPDAMTMQAPQVPANGEIVNIDNIAPVGATLDSAMQTPTQTPVATPQQLDQMLADPATVNADKVAPAAPSVFGTPAPVDPIAQPDVSAAAPAVQAPRGQGTVLATPEAPTAAPEVKAPGVMDTITENFAGSKLGKFFGGMTTYDVSRGGDVVSGSGSLVFPSLAEKTETPAYGASDIPVPPAVEMLTPESMANLSVNGTDVVTPEAITEAGQVAPAAVAPQSPTAGSGGMITRDSTGESFIGGSQVAATPEEVSAYNATSSERMAAANTDAAAAERMRYNAPTIAEATGAGQTLAPRAPVRQTIQDRDRLEKVRETQLRKEGQRSIDDQMREFNNEPHSMKERAAKKAELQGELNKSIKEDKDYTRAETRSDFTRQVEQYNRGTLSASQIATQTAQEKEAAATAEYRARPEKQSANDKAIAWIRANIPAEQQNDAILNVIGVDPLDLPPVGKTPLVPGGAATAVLEGAASIASEPVVLGNSVVPKNQTRKQKDKFGVEKTYKFDGKNWNEVK